MKKKRLFLIILLTITVGIISPVQAESYDGEYSIDYLLRNYNVVTLGQKDNHLPEYYGQYLNDTKKGDIKGVSNIEGAVLINGDYTSPNYESIFGLNAGQTKSFIKGTKGNNVSTTSELETDANYIDFEKLYTKVLIESQELANKSTQNINSAKIEISKPGNYTVKNTSMFWYKEDGNYLRKNNTILIKDYDKDNYYIFNYYNEYIDFGRLPSITIMENGSPDTINLKDFVESGNYTGNIIFNFPNAKAILISYNYDYDGSSRYYNAGFSGSVVAPKADFYIHRNYYLKTQENNWEIFNYYYGNIIANRINTFSGHYNIKETNSTLDKQLLDQEDNQYIKEVKDYTDDIYTRDYSIKDLLQNYSLVTLGHKTIDSKSKLLEYGNKSGSVKLFHITGQALIAGDLYGKTYENELDDFYTLTGENWHVNVQKYDRTAFDLESNKVTESYIKGSAGKNVAVSSLSSSGYEKNFDSRMPISVIQPWDNMTSDTLKYEGQKNSLFIGKQESPFSQYEYLRGSAGDGNYSKEVDNYLSFDRLYNNVVAEQRTIKEGTKLKVGEDGIVHIPVGGSYNIEDISKVKEVVFDNFDKNKDELTIVTVKNKGDISFPLISKDNRSYKGIITNDYYGKESATHLYEQDTFIQDEYYGNIVWNVPNATYITLKEKAPFAGHLIAPNADVDTPETHFAGCFIVNSIYGEGNTEAHFYPITANLKCDCDDYGNLSDSMKIKFSEYRLNKLLGGDATTIETNILGDEEAYNNDTTTLEHVLNQCPSNGTNQVKKNPIIEVFTNPKTYRNLGLMVLVLVVLGGGIITYRKKENKKD